MSALSRVERIGGLPDQETMLAYEGAAELAQRYRAVHIAVVFVAAELEDAVEAIRDARSSVSVLTKRYFTQAPASHLRLRVGDLPVHQDTAANSHFSSSAHRVQPSNPSFGSPALLKRKRFQTGDGAVDLVARCTVQILRKISHARVAALSFAHGKRSRMR